MRHSIDRSRLCRLRFLAPVLALLGAVAGADPLPDSLTAAQMREDLLYLRDTWASADRSFSEAAKTRFADEVDRLAANPGQLTPQQFSLEVARMVAIGGNGHSAVSMPPMPALPIRVWPFDDGLFVVSAHPQHAELLGAQVVRIDTMPAAEALRRVSMFIPGNDEHRRIEAPRFLTNPLALERAGVVPHGKSVRLTIVDRQGRHRAVDLNCSLAVEPLGGDTWSMLVPADAAAPNRWPHILDSVTRRPEAFSSIKDLSYQWLSTTPRVLYVRSNHIASDDDTRLDMKLLDMTVKELVNAPAQVVIVDLRYNMGGNFYNTILFSQMLPGLLAADGKILVLTGPVTFSAALVTAAMLRMHGGAQVSFVGDHMGDDDRFWAEGRNLELPHSKLEVRYSDYYHDWSQPCREDKCLWATRIFGPKGTISLRPDVVVPTTFKDYAAGQDPVLTRALQLVGP